MRDFKIAQKIFIGVYLNLFSRVMIDDFDLMDDFDLIDCK